MPKPKQTKNLSILLNFQNFRIILERLLNINAFSIISAHCWYFTFKIFIFPLLLGSGVICTGWYITCAIKSSSDINLTFYSLVLFMSHIQVGTKICTLIWNRDKVTELLDWIEEFYILKEEDTNIKKIIEDQLNSTLNAVKICFRTMIIAYSNSAVVLISYFLYKGDLFVYRFPIPFNEPSFLHLTLLHIYQSGLIFFSTFFVVAGDITMATIGIHIMGLLRILSAFIRSLEDSIVTCSDFLHRIQNLHADIINRSRTFNDLLFHLLLVQLFSSIFMILMNFYAIQTVQSVGIAFYLLAVSCIIQLLLICLFGEVIFMRYSQVEHCLLLTTWYEMSLADQKNFILILRMAQKPYGIKAGGMYDVSMPIFIDIMKLTVSFCAILYTLME